jgi:hypothetical protein
MPDRPAGEATMINQIMGSVDVCIIRDPSGQPCEPQRRGQDFAVRVKRVQGSATWGPAGLPEEAVSRQFG